MARALEITLTKIKGGLKALDSVKITIENVSYIDFSRNVKTV